MIFSEKLQTTAVSIPSERRIFIDSARKGCGLFLGFPVMRHDMARLVAVRPGQSPHIFLPVFNIADPLANTCGGGRYNTFSEESCSGILVNDTGTYMPIY
jgi:hypothetical protein